MDTGCPVSIINAECYEKYFRDIPLRKSTLKLVSYCNTNIDVRGFFDAAVEFQGARNVLPLYVVGSTKHPLLGREWLSALAVDWKKVLQPTSVNAIGSTDHSAMLQRLFAKYSNVFDDSIGRISSVQANLRLKPNAKPVFLKARKIPFNMKKVVEDELDKLVAQGVLSKVDQSEWATPIVPVKKSENRVRICGDYKQTVNPLLMVDRHPLPTVDELFSSLAGG
nr:uncharacterized protein K02A2.6-like [Aedes albopictus]